MNSLKRSIFAVAAIAAAFLSTTIAEAQIKAPRPSPKASVMQTLGVTDVTITYSRPAVKGRKVFGDWPTVVAGEATLDDQNKRPKDAPLVPWGHIWRTGANEATQFVVTDDVTINGQKLAAGSYSLHTIPAKDGDWTIVFNGTANQWGSFSYDPAKDTLRVKAKPVWSAENKEYLNFEIEQSAENTAIITLEWEKLRLPFTVSVDVVATTLANAKKAAAAAKPDDFTTPMQAANFAMQNKMSDEAKPLFLQALKAADVSNAAKETFRALSAKANILIALGRKDEAYTVADLAVARGKADKVDTAAFEKRIADIKAGKM